MQGIEGEREQAECCSVQSCVVCKSRIFACYSTKFLTAVSSNIKYVVSLWSTDCESSITCCAPAQV